ncbi:uncharacterized protein [Typha angustifolia]|uniref:uncharacterized protein isoform X2 n=1 Tax=Typha angustifolia TaxID=59011 RepID=UPI003C2CB07F
MSGGFFRGTSADQDTRFSNKQAKLLKSQKFAPELDHLVDMSKVKMDVIRPWIATRATELLGFEDEVLINFVYGLLDGKEVDGKQIQIQLTGFMEKNTGKFMRELWGLLLSAQQNASGVPQQFLDAKEEETRKRQADNDRITQEIQKRREKEGREVDQERQHMDGEAKPVPTSVSKWSSTGQPDEERDVDVRHGSRERKRRSSSESGSRGKSFSKSRSYSREARKSRSISISSQSRSHSLSPKIRSRSPPRRSLSSERQYSSPHHSISPPRRHSQRGIRSPMRRRYPYNRQRSPSISRRRSRSPFRWISPSTRRRSPPLRRRSPSPMRRKPPSPLRRRSPSPVRRRSPSPARNKLRSPVHRISPSPRRLHRGSPTLVRDKLRSVVHRRSPSPLRLRRRSPSPVRRRSPSLARHRLYSDSHSRSPGFVRQRSPVQRRSSSPTRRGSPSPLMTRSPQQRSPRHQRMSPLSSPRSRAAYHRTSPQQKRSRSPYRSQSPSYRSNRSLNGEIDKRISGVQSRRDEGTAQRSRDRRSSIHHTDGREVTEPADAKNKVSNSVSRSFAESLRSPKHDLGKQDISKKEHGVLSQNSPYQSDSPILLPKVPLDNSDMDLHKRQVRRPSQSSEEIVYGRGRISEETHSHDGLFGTQQSIKSPVSGATSLEKRLSNGLVMKSSYVRNKSHSKVCEHRESDSETDSYRKSKKKIDESSQVDSIGSGSAEADIPRERRMEKHRHKKSNKNRRNLDETSDSDSQTDDKEAKKRRKDEKRLRKEERRRRREERRRKRLERRESKGKLKSVATVTPPSDLDKNRYGSDESDGDPVIKKVSESTYKAETEFQQKKLEIELREKALESLRAKKAISR